MSGVLVIKDLSLQEPGWLVEVKDTDQAPDAGTGQVRSYAYWIKPAYYATTNGDVVVVNYQGGAVPTSRSWTLSGPNFVTGSTSSTGSSILRRRKQPVRQSRKN
jgi:hypothetical protein